MPTENRPPRPDKALRNKNLALLLALLALVGIMYAISVMRMSR